MQRNIRLVILVSLISALTLSVAQTPYWEWVTPMEGFVFRGMSVGNPDPDGSFYCITNFDSTLDIHPYYFYTPGFSVFNGDIAFLKFDSVGTPLWAKQYGGKGLDAGYGFIKRENGNSYFAALVESQDFYLNGDSLPMGTYLLNYDSQNGEIYKFQEISETSRGRFNLNGDFLVKGSFNDTLIIGNDTLIGPSSLFFGGGNFIASYDSMFRPKWAKMIHTDGSLIFSNLATNIHQTDFYLLGLHYRDKTGITPTDTLFGQGAFIIKMNDQAEVKWIRQFPYFHAFPSGVSFKASIPQTQFDAQNNLYVLGHLINGGIITPDTTLIPGYAYHYWLAKFDPDGNMLWIRSSQGNNSYIRSPLLAVSPEGRSYVGSTMIGEAKFGPFEYRRDSVWDMFVVAYDTDGNELWVKGSDTPLDPKDRTIYDWGGISSMSISPKGNLLVSGGTRQTGFQLGNTTFHSRYAHYIASLTDQGNPLGVNIENPEIAFQLFPNPTEDNLNIKFTLHQPQTLQLTLYDLTGKKVAYKNYGPQPSGSGQETLFIQHLAPGMYMVEVKVGQEVVTEKIVKR